MKLKEITPEAIRCTIGACPAIYETQKGSFIIVGKRLSNKHIELEGRVGQDEDAVEIPMSLLSELFQKKKDD